MNTMTSQKQTSLFTEENATSSQEGSHVSPSPLPGSNLAQQMTDTSGLKCLEQYEKLNHAGLLAKMFPALLVGQTGWYSIRCYLTWKLKATKSGRVYFRLQASTPRTSEIGFGLLLTPISTDVHHKDRVEKLKLSGAETMASRRLGANRPNGLMDYLDFNGLLPTPQARDYKGGRTSEALEASGRTTTNSLNDAFNQPGKTSQLNHRFVLEMMGFQPTHCDSAFEKIVWARYLKKKSTKSFQKRLLSGLKKPSKPEVTL